MSDYLILHLNPRPVLKFVDGKILQEDIRHLGVMNAGRLTQDGYSLCRDKATSSKFAITEYSLFFPFLFSFFLKFVKFSGFFYFLDFFPDFFLFLKIFPYFLFFEEFFQIFIFFRKFSPNFSFSKKFHPILIFLNWNLIFY